jgi:hypothetical protein
VKDLLARAERLPELLAADPHLQHRGRFIDAAFLLEIAGTPYHAVLRNGALTSFTRGPLLMRSWRFALRGTAEAFENHWQNVPPPGFHDLLALTKFGHARLEGDLHPLLSNLQFFKDLLALPRSLGDAA